MITMTQHLGSMQLTCEADVKRLEAIVSELGIKQREPSEDQRWIERIDEIKDEGAEKLVLDMVADPYQELAIIYQMALDGMESCDIGQYIAGKVKRLVEQRAIPILNRQAD